MKIRFCFQLMTMNTQSLRILNVSGCKVITDEQLRAVVAANKFLHTVDLSRCHHLTSASLHTIAASCKKLQRYVKPWPETDLLIILLGDP